MEPLINGVGLMRPHRGTQAGAASTLAQLAFEAIEMADLAQEPACDERVLFARFVKLAADVRLMWSST